MKKIILLLFLLTILPQALGFGIAPAQKTTFNLQEDYSVRILNNQNEEFTAIITIPEEYNEYIQLSTNTLTFNQNTQSELLQIKTNIPKEALRIGTNKIPITIIKQSSDSSQVSARIAITHDLTIINPSMEPFIDFEIQNTNFDTLKKGQITIKLINQGQTNTDAELILEILTQNKTTQTLNQNTNIQGLETKNINFEFEPKQIGNYEIKATIKTPDQEITKTKNVQIGTPKITIKSIKPNPYKLGEIANFELVLESNWPEKINGNIKTNLLTNSNIISSYETNFEVQKETKINTYHNTQNINPGRYQKQITITQNQITNTVTYNLIITQNSIHIIDNEGNVLTRIEEPQKTNYTKIGFIISITIFLLVLIYYLYLKYKK
jgi:hypothetical protein